MILSKQWRHLWLVFKTMQFFKGWFEVPGFIYYNFADFLCFTFFDVSQNNEIFLMMSINKKRNMQTISLYPRPTSHVIELTLSKVSYVYRQFFSRISISNLKSVDNSVNYSVYLNCRYIKNKYKIAISSFNG